MADGRLRLLVLDDDPAFIDSETALLTFSARSGPVGRDALERNFKLAWMYDLGQAKEFAARVRIALLDDPTQLLDTAPYPNLLWFDYAMDRSQQKARDLRTYGSLDSYRTSLDPLAGDWGRNVGLLGHDEDSFAAEVAWRPLPDDQHGGCIAGVDITSLLDAYAMVGVPQTVNRAPVATASLEWHLGTHLGRLFALKSGRLANWFAFLDKALPALRHKLRMSCLSGTLIPHISDLLELAEVSQLKPETDRQLRFSSRLGTEALRVEALFLDLLHAWDDDGHRLAGVEPGRADDAVCQWATGILETATGVGRSNDLRYGLETAARFVAAHADPLHYHRRALSRDLAAATGDETEMAVREHDALIRLLGLDPQKVASAMAEGRADQLVLSEEAARDWGVLDSVKAEAPTPAAARIAALAVLVWGEMAWQGGVCGDFDGWLLDVEDALKGGSVLKQAKLDRINALSGVVMGDAPIRAALDSVRLPEHRRRFLDKLRRDTTAFAAIQDLAGLDPPLEIFRQRDPDARAKRASQETEAKHGFLRHLFAPAPRQLLCWSEAPKTDVDKPLARLGEKEGALKLKIRAVLEGRRGIEQGGLQSGEGRLVRMLAGEFGFAERHWPRWMKEAAL